MTDALLQAVLVGAGQTGIQPLRAEDPADALGEGMGLLLRAGLRAVYRQAGRVPLSAPEPFPPEPEVREAVCPLVMEPALRAMLECGPRLPSAPGEACRALARRGWVLPPGILVDALSSQRRLPELRLVLGARGRWLAGLNPVWRWAIAGERALEPSEVAQTWTEGTKAERVALIRRLRETDPAGARDLLAAGFAAEPADLRQDLIRALEIGLTPADEPLLESALDDRSKGVRQAAASLLARLPASAFVGRMVTRARGLVVRRTMRRGVDLQPASELPEDWRRDGIGLTLPGRLDHGLAWTIQVLASMPAAVLARELDVSPEDVIEAAEPYGVTPLIEAWRQNAGLDERDALLPALWDAWWARPLQRTTGEEALAGLVHTIPRDALRRRVLRLLGDPPGGTERFIVLVLNEMDEPWPADVSRSALDLVRRWLERTRRKDRNAGEWPPLIRPLATHAAPETIEAALELLADIERANILPPWNPDVRQGPDALRLRGRFWDAMMMAITDNTTP